MATNATNDSAPRLQAALGELIAAVARVTTVLAEAIPSERAEYANAKALGISQRTLRRIVSEGDVTGFHVGREILVRRDDWDAYVATKRVAVRAERPRRLRRIPGESDDLAALREQVAAQ